jgi:hypothetical protein
MEAVGGATVPSEWDLDGRAALGNAGRKVIRRRQLWIHDKGAEGYQCGRREILAPSSQAPCRRHYYRVNMDTGIIARYWRRYSPAQLPPKLDSAAMEQGEVRPPLRVDFNSGMFGLLIAGPRRHSARFPASVI